MKIYTKKEKQRIFEADPLIYVTIAHQYPCQELPEKYLCEPCAINYCNIKKYYDKMIYHDREPES